MLETNETELVALSVIGEIASPLMKSPYRIYPDGSLRVLPSVGGISYNCRIGDPAVGIAADHVEPGVSIKNTHQGSSNALNILACVGNEARVVSGDGKGLLGRVTGKHGGVEHLMIDFPPDKLDLLTIGDRIQIKSFGTGLKLPKHPDVTVMSVSPWLLEKLDLKTTQSGKLQIPVTHTLPAQLLGAGLGEDQAYSGDVDIQLFDEETVAAHNLSTLRLGDFVAMLDCDHRYGRIYKQGAVSIGVVTHSCSTNAGHGPGVTTLFTSVNGGIELVLSKDANLCRFF